MSQLTIPFREATDYALSMIVSKDSLPRNFLLAAVIIILMKTSNLEVSLISINVAVFEISRFIEIPLCNNIKHILKFLYLLWNLSNFTYDLFRDNAELILERCL